MTLSDLASIASLVSGIAVLVSLVYLSLQVRQTERNQRALMNQGVINRATDIIMWTTQGDISVLVAKMLGGETSYSNEEAVQLSGYARCMLVSLQDNYLQHKNGLIDKISLETSIKANRRLFAQPVMRSLYKTVSQTLAPEFVEFIELKVCVGPLAEPYEPAKQLIANLSDAIR